MSEQPLLVESNLPATLASHSSPHPNSNCPVSTTSTAELQRQAADLTIITKVEKIFESIVDGLLRNSDELSIPIKIKKSCAASRSLVESGNEAMTEIRKVTFPGRTAHEAWRFSRSFEIIILDLADNGCSRTVSDIGADT